jgi:hypothetical protein
MIATFLAKGIRTWGTSELITRNQRDEIVQVLLARLIVPRRVATVVARG